MQIDMPKLSFGIGIAVMIETAIGGGTLSLTHMIPADYIPSVQAWANALAFVGATLLTGLHAYAGPSSGVLASPPTVAQAQQIMTAAKAATVIVLAVLLLWPVGAVAQARKPVLTGNPVNDIKNAITPGSAPTTSPSLFGNKSDPNTQCDFNIFNNLKPETLIAQLKTCASDTLVEDTSEALDSATAIKDQVGVTCLTPGLAILKAAQAAFGQAPSPTPAAAPATTTPPDPNAATPTPTPAAPNGPTFKIRLILLFQKWREFGIAGGPSACKSWVQTTITMTNPLLQ